MAATVHMPTAQQRDDLTVVKPHSIEDLITDMHAQLLPSIRPSLAIHAGLDVLLRAGQAAVGRVGGRTLICIVGASGDELDGGPACSTAQRSVARCSMAQRSEPTIGWGAWRAWDGMEWRRDEWRRDESHRIRRVPVFSMPT